MECAQILLATLLILQVFHKYDAVLNLIPRDTEVKVNDSTYMNCSTSLEAEKIQWRHGNNYVYAGRDILEPYNVRFSVEINSSTGTNNLVIRSVQTTDAGQYECLEDEGYEERRSAQLTVFNDDPVCKSSIRSSGVIGPNTCGIEPDDITLSCSVTYYGNIFPVLQWKASGVNKSDIGLFNFTTNKNEVTYTLTMKSTLDLSDSSFICQTTRTSNRNYSCSSDVIKILYIFRSNVTVQMTMYEKVTCIANTSQSCNYKWKWYSGYEWIALSNDQTLKPNKVGWHRCEAICLLGNKSCTVQPIYVEVYSTLPTNEQILLSLLVLLVALLIGVVICLWRKMQYGKRKRNASEESESDKRKQKQSEIPNPLQEPKAGEELEQQQQRLIGSRGDGSTTGSRGDGSTTVRRRKTGSFTNDEVKERIQNIFADFVTCVDPDRLKDYLLEKKVITLEEWRIIHNDNSTTRSRCRDLLNHLLSIPHPTAFLIVRESLIKEDHYLLESIDNQEPGEFAKGKRKASKGPESKERKPEQKRRRRSEFSNPLAEPEAEEEPQQEPQRQIDKLRSAYESDPVLLQTIKIKVAEDTGIVGMTILDKELFVASGGSSEVEVYDSLKFSFSRRWKLKELFDPVDIGSCNKKKCLYIFDFKCDGQSRAILRVDPNGKLINKWSTGGDYLVRLSVTDESNVILTVAVENKLNEYSSDGQFIREINLSEARIRHPRHAIKLTNGHFLVSHGEDGNFLHRVCVVDGDGILKKSFGRKCGSTIGEMNRPEYLAIDGNGFVMVADRDNGRVLLLDSDLKFKREILSKEKHGLRRPERILLDETNNRLFVTDNKWNSKNRKYYDGQIFIFDFRQ